MADYKDMEDKARADMDRVELRSEKVRNIIGEIPSFLIRWGNTVLVLIFLSLTLLMWMFWDDLPL